MPRYQILVEGEPVIITVQDMAEAQQIREIMRDNHRPAFILDTATGERLPDAKTEAVRSRENPRRAS